MDESVTAVEAFFGITPILNEDIEYKAVLRSLGRVSYTSVALSRRNPRCPLSQEQFNITPTEPKDVTATMAHRVVG